MDVNTTFNKFYKILEQFNISSWSSNDPLSNQRAEFLEDQESLFDNDQTADDIAKKQTAARRLGF